MDEDRMLTDKEALDLLRQIADAAVEIEATWETVVRKVVRDEIDNILGKSRTPTKPKGVTYWGGHRERQDAMVSTSRTQQ